MSMRQNETPKRKKIDSVQLLRAFAALSVMFFHYRLIIGPSVVGDFFNWGSIGVDLFFVISGFIMAYTTLQTPPNAYGAIKFIRNRFIRIMPVYYILLLVAFLLGGAMSTFHYPEKVTNLISAITFSVYTPDTGPLYTPGKGLFNVRWTLNYELYFYMIFSLILLSQHRAKLLVLWGLSMVVIIPALLSYDISLSTKGYMMDSVSARFLTNPIILEFIFGAMIGLLYKHIVSIKKTYSKIIFITTLFVVAIGIYTGKIHGSNVQSSLFMVLLLVAFLLENDFISKITPRFLIYIGNISFSLYLVHNTIGNYVFSSTKNILFFQEHTVIQMVILIIPSLLVASLSYELIEVRFTNWLKARNPVIFKINQPALK